MRRGARDAQRASALFRQLAAFRVWLTLRAKVFGPDHLSAPPYPLRFAGRPVPPPSWAASPRTRPGLTSKNLVATSRGRVVVPRTPICATTSTGDRTWLVSGKPNEVGGLYERLRAELRLRRYSPRTERACVGWLERYVAFHDRRHPATLGAPELKTFLDALVLRKLAPSSHQQALCALHFFYAKVLRVDPPWVQSLARPTQRQRLPLVLSRDEVRAVLTRMSGVPALMASLLYGSGLRLLECARLRVKDVDFSAGQLVIRNGKGNRDRVALLPVRLRGPLHAHLQQVRCTHRADLKAGAGYVELPGALLHK
jgi:hypothetical protein